MTVAVRRALYGKLSGDVTLNALLPTPPAGWTKSIYYRFAPQGAAFPYVILSQQAGTPVYAYASRAYDNDIWLVKGIDRHEDTDRVEDIAARLDALLTDGTISISGRTQLYLRREVDITYSEEDDGVEYHHAGSNYRVMYQ